MFLTKKWVLISVISSPRAQSRGIIGNFKNTKLLRIYFNPTILKTMEKGILRLLFTPNHNEQKVIILIIVHNSALVDLVLQFSGTVNKETN